MYRGAPCGEAWKSLEHLPLDAESAGLVLGAWVVGRVDVLDAAWTDEMDLDDSSFIAWWRLRCLSEIAWT
jgi:hypothetical protein